MSARLRGCGGTRPRALKLAPDQRETEKVLPIIELRDALMRWARRRPQASLAWTAGAPGAAAAGIPSAGTTHDNNHVWTWRGRQGQGELGAAAHGCMCDSLGDANGPPHQRRSQPPSHRVAAVRGGGARVASNAPDRSGSAPGRWSGGGGEPDRFACARSEGLQPLLLHTRFNLPHHWHATARGCWTCSKWHAR
jgi:hypothetical protein